MPSSLIASRSNSNNIISPSKSKERWIKDDISNNVNVNHIDSDYADDRNAHENNNLDSGFHDSTALYEAKRNSIIQVDAPSIVTSSSSSSSSNSHSSDLLWMLVDGIGLAIVAGATIMEGIHLWNEFFHSFWYSNHISIIFWLLGRSCQVFGIVILIGNLPMM